MKKLFMLLLVVAIVTTIERGFIDAPLSAPEVAGGAPASAPERGDAFAEAFARGSNNVQLQGAGVVERLLSDDNSGSRHQRFIVRLPSGQTLLITHNIDLAPRVASLDAGDAVEFFGEYEWNREGGVMHWTHDDPQGRHAAGWIRHAGRTYR